MSNNSFIATADLDFDSYKQSLKTYLQGQDRFKDYDFDGSNMSVLLDLLAYNTYVNGFYLNMVGSEMFLDTAQLKESAVSRAKELNYVPRSRVSAKAVVQITISGVTDGPSTLTIPKGYYVSGLANNQTYLFSTNEAHILRFENNLYQSANVDVYEGRVVNEYFTANLGSRFVLASSNVDTSSIEVTVINSSTDANETPWVRAYNLYGVSNQSNVFFVQGHSSNQYEIVFGNGFTGRNVSTGNVVRISYRDCSGAEGNRVKPTKAVNNIEGYGNIKATLIQTGTGGAEREDVDSIRFNAPRHFSSQDRAVTKDDYSILIRNNFPTIQAISVFGGEELPQKRYGKVVIATKPYDAEITPDALKGLMNSFLSKRTAVGIDPIFSDPDYFNVQLVTKVYYNPTSTDKTTSDIETLVRAAINQYSNTYLYDFNADFRYSKMVQTIDSAHSSIVSNDTKVRMSKRIYPPLNDDYATTLYFYNAFDVNSVLSKTPTSAQPIIESTYFTYNEVRANFVDDGLGHLQIWGFVNGVNTLLKDTAGVVDYVKGVVDISHFQTSGYTGHIAFHARLASSDIIIKRAQIILIDQADVTVTVDQAAN